MQRLGTLKALLERRSLARPATILGRSLQDFFQHSKLTLGRGELRSLSTDGRAGQHYRSRGHVSARPGFLPAGLEGGLHLLQGQKWMFGQLLCSFLVFTVKGFIFRLCMEDNSLCTHGSEYRYIWLFTACYSLCFQIPKALKALIGMHCRRGDFFFLHSVWL